MPVDLTELRLDPDKMMFPTDAITFRQIRAAYGHMFTSELIRSVAAFHIRAMRAHEIELQLADRAFFSAIRVVLPRYLETDDRRALVEELDGHYRTYQLSLGRFQTENLVRGIEEQALSQAAVYRGCISPSR